MGFLPVPVHDFDHLLDCQWLLHLLLGGVIGLDDEGDDEKLALTPKKARWSG